MCGKIVSHSKEYDMKRPHTIIFALILALTMMLSVGCGTANRQETDIHAGQVQVFNGNRDVWITPEDGVPVNTLKSDDFSVAEDGSPVYNGNEYETIYGVDVSSWQGEIDWQAVKDSGVDFAIIRIGVRGYGVDTGNIVEDSMFEENYAAAKAAGLKVGVYFFSQATNTAEAMEEADFVIDCLRGKSLDLPVYFDWEHIDYDTARTEGINGETVTDCAVAFCAEIELSGFDAGVYMYPGTAYYDYELHRLTSYDFWCAGIGDYPYFYYAHNVWQYSYKGSVPGISSDCDLNMMFIEK